MLALKSLLPMDPHTLPMCAKLAQSLKVVLMHRHRGRPILPFSAYFKLLF